MRKDLRELPTSTNKIIGPIEEAMTSLQQVKPFAS
jgi:hypothetical protein